MTQATPAAEMNPTEVVLEVCRAIVAGDNSRAGELAPVVERRRREINQGYAGFIRAIDEQGEKFEQDMADEITAVEHYFTLYDEALKQLEAYIEKPDPNQLGPAADELGSAAEGLRYAMTQYERKYLGTGSSSFTLINFFTNVAKRIKSTNESLSVWEAACDQNINAYKVALEEMEGSPDKNKPHASERREALKNMMSIITEMRAAGPQEEQAEQTGPARLFQVDTSLLGQLSEQLAAFQEATEAFATAELAQGPTKSLKANAVIRIIQGFLQGRTAPAVYQASVQGYLEQMQQGMVSLKKTAKRPSKNVMIVEELANLLEAMERADEALQALLALADGPVPQDGAANPSLQQLIQAVDKAVASEARIAELHAQASKVVCPFCQHLNEPNNLTCSSCHHALPNLEERKQSTLQFGEGSGDQILTQKTKVLLDACMAFGQGQISAEELAVHLNETERSLAVLRQETAELEAPTIPDDCPEEHIPFLKESIDTCNEGLISMREGMRECKKALDMLRETLSDPSMEDIQEGVRTYFEGTQKILGIARATLAFLHMGIDKIRENNPELIKFKEKPAAVVHHLNDPDDRGDDEGGRSFSV